MKLYAVPQNNQNVGLIPQDVPVYRVGDGKFYADDVLFETGAIIAWPDEPALSLEPMNDMAHEQMKIVLERVDAEGRKVAEKTGKMYINKSDSLRNAMELAKQEGRKVTQLNGTPQPPSILGKKRAGRPPRATAIDITQANAPVIAAPRGKSDRDQINGVSDA